MISEDYKCTLTGDIITLLGLSDDESDRVGLLVEGAYEDAVTYCGDIYHVQDTQGLLPIVRDMVAEKYNRLGSEGISARNFSGVSESYKDDYSPSIYKRLRKYRRLKTI